MSITMEQPIDMSQSQIQKRSVPETQNELRTAVKMWERAFETKNGHKPTSKDAKANKDIWKLYQKYRNFKVKKDTSSTMSRPSTNSPKKPRSKDHNESSSENLEMGSMNKRVSSAKPKSTLTSTPTKKSNKRILDEVSDADTEPDETPKQLKITEVFPTPQLKGKVLGLFDVELPETPQKPSQRKPNEETPVMQLSVLETPQSKRTPDYFLNRVNLFPSSEPATLDSPLFKRKKPSFTALVGNILENPESSISLTEPDLLGNSARKRANGFEQSSDLHKSNETDQQIELNGPDCQSTHRNTSDTQKYSKRRGPKRQTKRVIMRPINTDSEVSTAKATDNYRRLKINNTKKRPFRRR